MKYVVYTCIIGKYDTLNEINQKQDGVDYICFTDDSNLKSNTWDIRMLPDLPQGLTNVKKQRYIKIMAHKVLADYDASIWVDGNVSILGDALTFLEQYHKGVITTLRHPKVECLYTEGKNCMGFKDNPFILTKQLMKYKKEGMPLDYGMIESKLIIRNHNDKHCIELMETWWGEVYMFSHRDQVSFNYALWKVQGDVNLINKNEINDKYFKLIYEHYPYK